MESAHGAMKILTLNYEYPPIGGGASPVAADIARHLVARGHTVHVVTMAFGDLPMHEVKDGVEIFRVKCLRSKAYVSYPWEQLSYLIEARRFLKKHLKTHTYDVAHLHFIFPTGVLGVWLKKQYNLPFVITAHGSDVEGYNQNRFQIMHKLLRGPWKRICAQAFGVTAPSEYLRQLILKSDPSVRCSIVPNGIETDSYSRGPKEKTILTMCRLQPHKGVQDVIRAFAVAAQPGWTLRVVGDGPYRAELEQIAQHCGISDRVEFTGWVESKSERLRDILAHASVFVSMSRFESFGVSAAEAIASGCAVTLSDIPTHRYFARFGASLVPLDDPEALATSLTSAMQQEVPVEADVEALDWRGIVRLLEELLERAKSAKHSA